MLTSLYYYNHYRPYIVGQAHRAEPKRPIMRQTASEKSHEDDSYSVFMNKSLKSDVVNFAKDIYTSVVGLKNSSKNVIHDIGYINKYLNDDDFDLGDFTDGLIDDLNEFKDTYNTSVNFASTQAHSQSLSNYSMDIYDSAYRNNPLLNKFGLEVGEDGLMASVSTSNDTVSDKDINAVNNLKLLDKDSLTSILKDSAPYFNEINNYTNKVLDAAMANHMSFKGLTYYYSYKFDRVETDSFQLIRSGLLVDVAL